MQDWVRRLVRRGVPGFDGQLTGGGRKKEQSILMTRFLAWAIAWEALSLNKVETGGGTDWGSCWIEEQLRLLKYELCAGRKWRCNKHLSWNSKNMTVHGFRFGNHQLLVDTWSLGSELRSYRSHPEEKEKVMG